MSVWALLGLSLTLAFVALYLKAMGEAQRTEGESWHKSAPLDEEEFLA